LKVERPNSPLENQGVSGPMPLPQKRIEPTFTSPRNERAGAGRSFQGSSHFSIPIQPKGK